MMRVKIVLAAILLIAISLSFAPAEAGEAEKFQFVVMGDNRDARPVVQPEIYRKIIQEVNLLNPDLVVIGGDLILGYTSDDSLVREEWKEFKRVTGELEMKAHLVVGNHDVWDEMSQRIYVEECGELYYSFNYRGSHFIILDTELVGEMERITGDQLKWLQKDLNKNRKAKYIFVFMHKPLWAYEGEPGEAWSRDVHPLLVKYGVDIVFSSHWHTYEIDYRDGIRYVITGGAGAPIGDYPEAGNFFHYLLCTVAEKGVEIAVIKPGNISEEEVVRFADAQRHYKVRTQCLSYPYLDLPLSGQSQIEIVVDNPFPDSISGTLNWDLEGFADWEIEPPEISFAVLPGVQSRLSFKVTPPKGKELWYPTPTLKAVCSYVAGKNPLLIERDIRLVPNYECERAWQPPVIDGELPDWKGIHPLLLNKRYQVASRDTIRWTGPEDKSGKISFSWDDKSLYFSAQVTDDILYQEGKGSKLSKGDCIILSFDVGDDPRKVGKPDEFLTVYFFALTKAGPKAYRWYPSSEEGVCSAKEIKLRIRRTYKGEVYEAQIPWAALKAGFTPGPGTVIGLDIDLTDNDGGKREGWLQWTPGMMERNDTSYLGRLILR